MANPKEQEVQRQAFDISTQVQAVYRCLNQHDFGAAHQYVDGEIAKHGECAHLLSLKALVLVSENRGEEALKYAEAAVQKDPSFAFNHYVRARVLDDLHLFHEAIISICEAIRIAPEDPVYHAELTLIYFQQERWVEAISAAARGLDHVPGDPQLIELRRAALAMLEKERGHTTTVTGDTLQRITLNADISADRGWVELCNKDYERAFEYFSEALLLDPEHTKAQKGMLVLMRRTEKGSSLYFYLINRIREHQRVGILTAVLLVVSATCHIMYADTLPVGYCWYIPGLVLLGVFAGARWLLQSFIVSMRKQWRLQRI